MDQGTGSGRNIAVVTYDAQPRATDDDRYLVDALVRRGVAVEERPWSDVTVEWERYDAVIVRSCWDYFHRAVEFHRWLDELEARGARVFNAMTTLRWNADKAYLRDLDASGVPVIPTHWIDRGATSSLEDVRRRTGWSELVVKPAVSGGAHRTWRASPGELTEDERLAEMAADGTVLVQPLVDEIESEGEWSLIFFDGRFSHAVIKRPRAGDFRVQTEHGGTVESIVPPASIIADAARALSHAIAPPYGASRLQSEFRISSDVIAPPAGALHLRSEFRTQPLAARPEGEVPLYARVDGCVVDGTLMLMELELLEPELFLRTDPAAGDRLAEALLARLR